MKKWIAGWITAVLLLSLAGCGAEETFETISDVYAGADPAAHRAVVLELPEGAAAPVMESGQGQIYLFEDFEITLQTMAAGDLKRTVKAVTGYDQEDLTVMQTQMEGISRYDFVWSAAGEGGEQIGRAAVLDDGNYHYVLTALTDAKNAGDLRKTWNAVFSSYGLD